MNKITKRIVAGVSAAALLVSAVGVDQLADLFMKTSYAIYNSKTARSTGFGNLEQDTDDIYYNTGYGLHTNKTATALDDGRTFNVNLESWYVGENPVDVATILDASGSMAWTVDTLEPLKLNATSMGINVDELKTTYSINNADLEKYTDYKGELTKVLAAIQDKNKGYLPQEVVDKILDPENTDNSKLSYADYMYYVYEARSSVSEFVPLGYWGGGKTAEKFSPIGYYPFNGTLKNEVNGKYATVIKNTTEGTAFDEAAIMETAAPDYYRDIVEKNAKKHGEVLYLNDSVNGGAVFLDVSKDSLLGTDNNFSVLFQTNGNKLGTGNTDIIYIGDLNNTSNGIRIFYDKDGHLKIQHNATVVDTGKNCKDGWQTFKFVFEGSTVKCTVGKDTLSTLEDFTFDLSGIDADDFGIIVGGLLDGDKYQGINNLQIDNIYLFNKALVDTDITKLEGTSGSGFSGSESSSIVKENLENFNDSIVGLYSFDGSSLYDSSTSNADGIYIKQSSGAGFDKSSTPDTSEATAEYSSDGKSLSINNLGRKNRAVLLDAKPSDDYTISFEVQVTSSDQPSVNRNIMYVGKNDTSAYYTWYRTSGGSQNQLKLFEKYGKEAQKFTDRVLGNPSVWKTVTFAVEKGVVKFYLDGVEDTTTYTLKGDYGTDQLSVILAGLLDNTYEKDDIFVKNVYVFDKALDADQVAAVAKATEGQTQFAKLPSALTGGCEGYHATTEIDGKDVAIAQIKDTLAQNPNDEERKGWYYVNSHSKWEDIEGCLASGKQYIGIYDKASSSENKDGIDNVAAAGRDIATIPSGADSGLKTAIQNGNTDDGTADPKKFNKAPENERSIRFYVDSQNHLRCFAWSGSTSKDGDIRTFCSLVYEKGYNDDDNSEQITKYEELNNALNTFYQKIAEKSDLSNNAVVRFSTNSAINTDKTTGTEKTKENLKKLIMKDWTNWSDYYQKYKEDNPGSEPETTDYLQNLLQAGEKSSTDTTKSSHEIDEYPYVMTGGTYTWTGLKAFYDNMVNKDATDASQTTKDIANDARDKYLIIFTDGRDNTQDYDVSDKTATDTSTKLAGSPDYNDGNIGKTTFGKENYVKNYNPYAEDDPDHKVGFSIKNYGNNWGSGDADPRYQVQQFITGDHKIEHDGDLAEAWADKLKDEGYTIYCVMMASGSISPTANEAEYNKAKNFLKSLSGSNELDAEIEQRQNAIDYGNKPDGIAREQQAIEALRDEYVIVVDPTVTGGMTVTDAFQQILEDIQLPRNDYTVQDYIDPRFDLVDKDGNLYKLGAGGKITVTKDGEAVESLTTLTGTTTGTVSGNTVTVENIIDKIDKKEAAIGLAYTPRESYMVNRKADSSSDDGYDTGNIGTGYIYYDDVKDMYYLRWTDQIIPMENEAFDTAIDHKNLDVWSATIRLKAKDDFIGGNNILTNGNEAGENLVYSDATIENMTDNPTLYFTEDELKDYKVEGKDGEYNVPYRVKLCRLSGTDRKINAVDAGGVSQAVYGNGIDIPSSGFPRTTVNVRLLPLDANDLNDVIYMGEVVSPTMMLADLENGYMTGSYYLQYLERYAYRVYGEGATKQPLLELLNQWLKINIKDEESKTFTIPYIYLPDPEYNEDGDVEKINNSTGWDSELSKGTKFEDLNLRDVTGFITYTWKREDEDVDANGKIEGNEREPQQVDSATDKYDITKDYVVKNTNQIKYNLQLTFTPLKETDLPTEFSLGENFINDDKFFTITDGEFADSTEDKWTITPDVNSNRTDYLQAMIQEKRTYTPHVMYDTKQEKWVLVDEKSDDFKAEKAVAAYVDNDVTKQTENAGDGKVTDSGVYDWTPDYKPASGNAQLEGNKSDPMDKLENIKDYYTTTPNNVKMLDVGGKEITDDEGAIKAGSTAPVSLAANTTYTKDVVNAALALELFVDGKYLNTGSLLNPNTGAKTFEFIATRYYDDPIDPLPYGGTVNASTDVAGQKYKLTFKVNELPENPQSNEIYRVWATLDEVRVGDSTEPSGYKSIKDYGYADINALPIGTYVIDTADNPLATDNFKIANVGTAELTSDLYFKYLKIDNEKNSYTHDKFPETVSGVSADAAKDTKDGEYLIWNNDTNTDHSKENIAKNNREKTTDKQTVTFYFGTVAGDTSGDKGESVKDYLKEHPDDPTLAKFTDDYAKDRLGIIMLSASTNSLAITKEVKNTEKADDLDHSWLFKVTVTPDEDDEVFDKATEKELDLKWYKLQTDGNWVLDETTTNPERITFTRNDVDGTYTGTVSLKHDEKVVIDGLPEGTWQVVEDPDVFCTPHNDQFTYDEDEWQYNKAESTREDIDLTPASQVNYINEFPYELPSAGGSGTVRYILLGTLLTALGALLFAVLYFDRRKKARK